MIKLLYQIYVKRQSYSRRVILHMSLTVSQKNIALRKAKQMTQQDLAGKVRLSRALVAAWEKGRSSPNNEQLESLANILEVSYESLQSSGTSLPEQYNFLEE